MIVRMVVHVHRHVAVFVRMGVQVPVVPQPQVVHIVNFLLRKVRRRLRGSVKAESVCLFGPGMSLSVASGSGKPSGCSPGRVFESLDRMGSGIFVRRLSGEPSAFSDLPSGSAGASASSSSASTIPVTLSSSPPVAVI